MTDDELFEGFVDCVMPTLPACEGLAWLQIFRHWREARECRLPQSVIAERMGVSVRTIRRAIQGLESKGLISVQTRGCHGRFANAYVIVPEKIEEDTSGR